MDYEKKKIRVRNNEERFKAIKFFEDRGFIFPEISYDNVFDPDYPFIGTWDNKIGDYEANTPNIEEINIEYTNRYKECGKVFRQRFYIPKMQGGKN